jgi:hypothetical protein
LAAVLVHLLMRVMVVALVVLEEDRTLALVVDQVRQVKVIREAEVRDVASQRVVVAVNVKLVGRQDVTVLRLCMVVMVYYHQLVEVLWLMVVAEEEVLPVAMVLDMVDTEGVVMVGMAVMGADAEQVEALDKLEVAAAEIGPVEVLVKAEDLESL